jgi:hypothetical protein
MAAGADDIKSAPDEAADNSSSDRIALGRLAAAPSQHIDLAIEGNSRAPFLLVSPVEQASGR